MAGKAPVTPDAESWAPYPDAGLDSDAAVDDPPAPAEDEDRLEPRAGREAVVGRSDAGLGPRYLRFLVGAVLLVGLFERSELLSQSGLYILVAALVVLTAVGLAIGFANAGADAGPEAGSPWAANHYLVPVMAVAVGGAVSVLVADWRMHLGGQLLMTAAIFSAGYVTLERFRAERRPGHDFLQDAALILVLLGAYAAILAGITSLPLRLLLLFVATCIAAYENLSRATPVAGRALVGGVIVGQVVTAIAFGLISYQFLDVTRLATILLVAWYVNRGMGYHMLEGSMSRGIFFEYVLGALVCVSLVATALLTH
ncbi:MAG: hypothetical protein QOE92_2372 [Chloroflexota bacterium]|jgi:hypothetical protein|nr:hypothetical protein [Chloroflexota bacterium]